MYLTSFMLTLMPRFKVLIIIKLVFYKTYIIRVVLLDIRKYQAHMLQIKGASFMCLFFKQNEQGRLKESKIICSPLFKGIVCQKSVRIRACFCTSHQKDNHNSAVMCFMKCNTHFSQKYSTHFSQKYSMHFSQKQRTHFLEIQELFWVIHFDLLG